MSEIETALESIREAADAVGLTELAREADVPYTTVRSFSDRGWTHKNLQIIAKLAAAARRIAGRSAAA